MRGGKLKKILFRTALVLTGIAVSAAGSFSLAKYISAEEAANKASVAGMGVMVFELENGKRSANIDYTQVVPGYDISVPRISLHLDSEISYTLYLAVTESSDVGGVHDWTDPELANGNAIIGRDTNGDFCEVVSYSMASWWNFLGLRRREENGVAYTVKYYSYNLGKDTEHGGNASANDNYMFKAGVEYNFTGAGGAEKTIGLIQNDSIFISEYYGVLDNTPPQFSLAFEAYIQQTLS